MPRRSPRLHCPLLELSDDLLRAILGRLTVHAQPVLCSGNDWATDVKWSSAELACCGNVASTCKRLSLLLCLTTSECLVDRFTPLFIETDAAFAAARETMLQLRTVVAALKTAPGFEVRYNDRIPFKSLRCNEQYLIRLRKEHGDRAIEMAHLERLRHRHDVMEPTIATLLVLLAQRTTKLGMVIFREAMLLKCCLLYTSPSPRDS